MWRFLIDIFSKMFRIVKFFLKIKIESKGDISDMEYTFYESKNSRASQNANGFCFCSCGTGAGAGAGA